MLRKRITNVKLQKSPTHKPNSRSDFSRISVNPCLSLHGRRSSRGRQLTCRFLTMERIPVAQPDSATDTPAWRSFRDARPPFRRQSQSFPLRVL
jgi:hypothetical protein